MRRWMWARVARLGVMVWAALWVTTALGAQRAEAQDLGAALRGLAWGASLEEVDEHFRKMKLSTFMEESAEIKDGVLKEKMRRAKLDEYKAVMDTYKELKGEGRTGYEVSVISNEFEKNNGESLVVLREDIAQKYYFFANKKLWKLAIAYNTEYIRGVDFDVFVDQVSSKYGEPVETSYDDYGEVSRAIWTDADTELRIENKLDFFGTFVMVFSDMRQVKRRERIHTAFAEAQAAKRGKVRAVIEDIQKGADMEVDENVVDSIVGKDIKVELESVLPEEPKKTAAADTPEADAADPEGLPEEEAKKRKRAKYKGGPAAKGGKGGKGGKGKKSLVIY